MSDNLRIPSKELEPLILNYCVKNKSFFIRVKQYLETKGGKSYFSDNKLQEVLNLFSRFYTKFEKIPKLNTMRTLVDRRYNDNEEIKSYCLSIVNSMYSDEFEYNEEFVEDEIKTFIQENRVYEAWFDAQKDVEKGDYGALLNKVENAVRINFDKDLGRSIKDVDELYKNIDNLMNQDTIDSGYGHLNSIIDGGFHKKEIYIISASPGLFKTGFLGNFAVNAFLQGKKVLVYTFETSEERLAMRYYANIVNTNKKEMLINGDEFKEKAKKIFKDMPGDLILKEYPANSICSNDLLAHMGDLKRYKDWEPDIVFADYIGIMAANDKSMSAENSFKYYKTITEELRNVGEIKDVPILTAAQINREGMSDRGGSKSVVTAKNIAESRGIYDTADFFAIITQTLKEKERNKYYLYIDKNRNDRTGVKIEFEVDYNRMILKEER